MKIYKTSTLQTETQALHMADPGIRLITLLLQALLPEKQTHSVQLVDSWSAHGLYLKLQIYYLNLFSHELRSTF